MEPSSVTHGGTAAARPSARAPYAASDAPPLVSAAGLFFPVAACYAALAVPLSVHGMRSGAGLVPGFAGAAAHAHELLFGFGLAVVAGFLVTRTSRLRLGALLVLWLAARASFLATPGSVAAIAANAGFAALLAAMVAPQFLRSAKKLRNRAIAPLLLVLCLSVLVFQAAALPPWPGLQFLAIQEAVLLFALLMLFMGGRIIAPAAAGAIQQSGGHLEHRVQPRIEGALLVIMALAVLGLAIPGGRVVAGALVLLAAVLALVRLLRWRLWAAAARPDLWCLGVGYGWLAIGLALLGLSWARQLLPAAAATHAITVGALGTLTATIMARVRLQQAKRDPAGMRSLPWIIACIALAAIIRMAGSTSTLLLGIAAACWSLGFLFLLPTLLRPAGGRL